MAARNYRISLFLQHVVPGTDKEALQGYCFSHFADVNNTLSSVSWPLTIKVAKQTQNQSEFIPPNSAWKEQITTPQSHESLVSPIPCQHPGQYRDRVKEKMTSAGCLMAWPLGFWIWDGSEWPSVSLRQALSDLELQCIIIYLSQVNSVCPLVSRTEGLWSLVSHLEAMGHIFAREDSYSVVT